MGTRQSIYLLNPNHDVFIKMRERFKNNSENDALDEYAGLLLGYALLAEGSELPDPIKFNQRIVSAMLRHYKANPLILLSGRMRAWVVTIRTIPFTGECPRCGATAGKPAYYDLYTLERGQMVQIIRRNRYGRAFWDRRLATFCDHKTPEVKVQPGELIPLKQVSTLLSERLNGAIRRRVVP